MPSSTMTERYPIKPDILPAGPLSEGDQAIVDAIEQVKPGARHDGASTPYVSRAIPDPAAGTFGESVVAFIQEKPDQLETAYVYIAPSFGILAAIDSRESGAQAYSKGRVAHLDSLDDLEVKREAARRIGIANMAVSSS